MHRFTKRRSSAIAFFCRTSFFFRRVRPGTAEMTSEFNHSPCGSFGNGTRREKIGGSLLKVSLLSRDYEKTRLLSSSSSIISNFTARATLSGRIQIRLRRLQECSSSCDKEVVGEVGMDVQDQIHWRLRLVRLVHCSTTLTTQTF